MALADGQFATLASSKRWRATTAAVDADEPASNRAPTWPTWQASQRAQRPEKSSNEERLRSLAMHCAVAVFLMTKVAVTLVCTAHSLGRLVPRVPGHLTLHWALASVTRHKPRRQRRISCGLKGHDLKARLGWNGQWLATVSTPPDLVVAASSAAPVFASSFPSWAAVAAASALGRGVPLVARGSRDRSPRRARKAGLGARSLCPRGARQAGGSQRASIWPMCRRSRSGVGSQNRGRPVCRACWAPAASSARRSNGAS